MGRKDDQLAIKRIGYAHIQPKRGIILVNHLSPAVVMKKIKLGPSDASGFGSLTDFLPELTRAEENQESQQVRREGAKETETVQNEEVSFIDTLTQDQLNDHVQKCLEMSSENKINLKNAFALKLIDCFAFLQKKKDFSAMACTLDAGTKIYSCRVDALHQQVIKLADEVVMNTAEKRADKDGETLPKELVAKGQRKARKNRLIASSETLTRQMKGKDPKDKYLRFEAMPGAILSGARRDGYDLSLCLERYTPFWPNWENYKPLKAKGKVSLPDIKIFRENPQSEVLEIPPRFPEPDPLQTDIELNLGEVNDAEANQVFEEKSLSEDITSIVDIPISQPSSCNEGNNSVDSDKEENESSRRKSFDGEADVVSTAMNRLQEEAKSDGAVNRAPDRVEALKILFDLSSEYNYLNVKNRNYWAGPEFWKRPQGLNEIDKEKRKVSNKKKDPTTIEYDFKDLNERLLILRSKTSSLLSDRIVTSWRKKKTTLPMDLNVDSSWFLQLFHVENCGEESAEPKNSRITNFVDVSDSLNENEEFTTDNSIPTDPLVSDHEDTSSSQDPLNATFYEAASGQTTHSDPRDDLDSTFYEAGPSNNQLGKVIRVEVASSTISDFGESTMVPIPKMIKVDPIKYSTRPIRLNMQHLKQAMLDVINEEIENNARKPEVKFRDVLKSLPRKLERRTREDLSTAIAFTALLSLANENSLNLEKCADGDFFVRF